MEIVYCLYIIYFVLLVLVIGSYMFILGHKRKYQGKLKLPPGSVGWPYIGETLQLYSQDPNVFFAAKQKRYGEIFKSHILGYPCVMLASPEAAKFVLVTQAHLFKPTYPQSKERLIGPSALFFHQDDYHLGLRKLVQASMSPNILRSLIPDIENFITSLLDTWHDREVKVFYGMKKFTFDVGILTIFGGHLDEKYKEDLKRNYFILEKGYNSFPTKILGTRYYKSIQARKRLRDILKNIVDERRENGVKSNDLLGHLMNSKNDKGQSLLTDEQVADNVIGVLFAAQDTTASVLTWIVKYLHDNPKLLEAVKTEQMKIKEMNKCGNQSFTWTQTRSMVLTNKVILESLRMSSIISFTYREAVADVEYKGYLIPKGWKVMPLFRNIHHNSEFFPDPHKFDPSRFKVAPKPNTFLPFGNGVHACPGNELAKLEMLLFIHHLVTKYRWEILPSKSEIEYGPFPIPKNGLPAKLWRVSPSS